MPSKRHWESVCWWHAESPESMQVSGFFHFLLSSIWHEDILFVNPVQDQGPALAISSSHVLLVRGTNTSNPFSAPLTHFTNVLASRRAIVPRFSSTWTMEWTLGRKQADFVTNLLQKCYAACLYLQAVRFRMWRWSGRWVWYLFYWSQSPIQPRSGSIWYFQLLWTLTSACPASLLRIPLPQRLPAVVTNSVVTCALNGPNTARRWLPDFPSHFFRYFQEYTGCFQKTFRDACVVEGSGLEAGWWGCEYARQGARSNMHDCFVQCSCK